MPRTYSYADAVKLLGARESRLLGVLDRLVGGALLGGATFGLSELLGWFDAKADFVRTAHELLVKAAEKRSGLSRRDRTERLSAAHAVIVVVAFFDALPPLKSPSSEALRLKRDEQLRFVGLRDLFDGTWPLPSAAVPYEQLLTQLKEAYKLSAEAVADFTTGLALWDDLSMRGQAQLVRTLRKVPDKAITRYRELLQQMAADYPELRFWFQVEDGMAARIALARLESELRRVSVGRHPDSRREELARRHRAALDRPIVASDEAQPSLSIPLLREAYIDPDFEVTRMSPEAQPSAQSWWSTVPRRSDLHRYLAGYLVSQEAAVSPLLVLGDPGSGKSMLTKVLAARLPADSFIAIRVELRNTPAEADLLEQVEHGVRAALQENVGWTELVRSAGDALPVILLDGLDELLQATGMTQSRYLLRVEQFQENCAAAGHPVAVVVTSRISVVGAVRVPPESHVLRLVPFTQEQITRWLEVWNHANNRYFNTLAPLPPTVVFRYMELAQQPLLLFMLALYDADDNALQRERQSLHATELYERLLHRFARRELVKQGLDHREADLEHDVEAELERLSVCAFAMFNRGVQWISEAELDEDLTAVLDVAPRKRRHGMSTPLSAGEALIGRFFFVQRAEAVRDSLVLRTYEFLHATFGEYLIARFTWHILGDLLAAGRSRPRRLTANPLDDSDLYALLSFSPLSSRKPVLNFLTQLAMASDLRFEVLVVVKRLFEDSFDPPPRQREEYRPVAHPVVTRHAVYNLNLVLLYGATGGPFDVRDLGITAWSRTTALWKSQLPPDEWNTLVRAIGVSWVPGGSVILFDDVVEPGLEDLAELVRPAGTMSDAVAEANFTADLTANSFRYPVEDETIASVRIEHRRGVFELAAVFAPPKERVAAYLKWADALPDLVLNRLGADPRVPVTALRELAGTEVGAKPAFWVQLFDRLGRGQDDHDLLDMYDGNLDLSSPDVAVAVLDAWLRLHESGFRFRDDSARPDLDELVERLPVKALRQHRPDLITRLNHARRDARRKHRS